MDGRKALSPGTKLAFPGMLCEIGNEIGRGSNAIVYQGSYADALAEGRTHRVLIKELFPLHPYGKIYRKEDGSVCVDPEGLELYELHRMSFETGNRAHLTMLEKCPDQIGANLNSYALNGTLYSILGVSGGNSLNQVQKDPAGSLRTCAVRMIGILDALSIFHQNDLLHLDIAPDNILLLGSGNRERALLIDYNSCMSVGVPLQNGSGTFSIKQGYTPPEIRAGKIRDIGFSTDLYSVTAVFFRMLTGKALTNFQMIRGTAPDITECCCVKNEPETVKEWVQEILRKGLQAVPARRYQTTDQMRQDLEELLDRIDGIGITHWALWEAGKKQAERMVRDNPSLSFLRDTAGLFPTVLTDEVHTFPAEEYLAAAQDSTMLLAGGGMGKTTALLRMAFRGNERYTPEKTAVMYLPLYGWQEGNQTFVVDSLLEGLRFRLETHSFTEARQKLYEMLDRPLEFRGETHPVMFLLLDGLNEVPGDTRPLLNEINRLASLGGVRVVVAGRTEEEALRFPWLKVSELTDEDVLRAISAAGLLFPESQEVRRILRTPLMLSLFIRSGKQGKHLAGIESADDILRAYLASIQEKAMQDLPGESGRRWQTEAAMELVLPAMAAEMERRHRALTDQELLPVIKRCYDLLNGKLSGRFFPRWIGRTAAIRGIAKNEEEWYGLIVHDLLWKQLGLIMRDNLGRYLIAHQMIGEYLLRTDRKNQHAIRKYHRIRAVMIAVCLFVILGGSVLAYRQWIAPKPPEPYNETYAKNIMSWSVGAYVDFNHQYQRLTALTDCAIQSPQSFRNQLNAYQRDDSADIPVGLAEKTLTRMMGSGKVMPWSGKPMDESACRKLLRFTEERREEYEHYTSVLTFVMTDDYAYTYYGEQYPLLLADLLEADANLAVKLYDMVCVPHLVGKYADHSLERTEFDHVYKKATSLNRHRTSDVAHQDLVSLEGIKEECKLSLQRCGVFDEYQKRGDYGK